MRNARLCAIVLGLILTVPMLVNAQVTSNSYSVTHTYIFQLPFGLPPISFFNYRLNAGAFEPARGWDLAGRNGQWAIVAGGAFADQVRVGTDLPRVGYTDAGATAKVSANVGNWGGGIWTASMTSSGSAHALFFPDRAFANSAMNTQVWAGWGWHNGRIVWRPIINDTVAGGAGAIGNRWRPVRNHDPIMVSGMDDAGNAMWTESFFDVFLELTGDLDWGSTGLSVNDPAGPVDMQLKINLASPYTVQHGLLDLDIRDGIVQTSTGTGDFSTLSLPPVGWNVGNSLTLSGLTNEFNLDYDLISLGTAPQLMFELSGDGAGVVPEPTTLILFSLGGMFLMRRRNS